jgi:hypothetical protein
LLTHTGVAAGAPTENTATAALAATAVNHLIA